MVVIEGKLRSAAICCVLGLCGVAVGADQPQPENGPSAEEVQYAPLPEEQARPSLADILGFDPVAVDANRERPQRVEKEGKTARQDALDRYEAELLADRRVPYGLTRTIRQPRTQSNASVVKVETPVDARSGDVASKEALGARFVEIDQDKSDALSTAVTVEEPNQRRFQGCNRAKSTRRKRQASATPRQL